MRRFLAIIMTAIITGAGCGSGKDILTFPDGAAEDSTTEDAAVTTETIVPEAVTKEQWVLEVQLEIEDDVPFTECLPGDGCFLDPCLENPDCQSGWCVEHMGDAVCSQPCTEECPDGWACKPVGGTAPDLVYVCVSDYANLCKPCSGNADCLGLGRADDVCVAYADGGSFCGGGCGEEQACPWGFTCLLVPTVDGAESYQCVSDAGVCPCTAKSVSRGLSTPCEKANEWGLCAGKRYCTEEGLSECDADAPSPEECDGIDNNCNGFTDEPEEVDGDFINLCNDDNDCTKDICGGQEGCSYEELTEGECLDGDACTVGDHCEEGTCVGLPIVCDDSNPCTEDFCDGLGGCTNEFNQADCDDDDPCTVADQCAEGVCVGYAVSCDCQTDADCAELEDENQCNGTLYCDLGTLPYQCRTDPETVVQCDEPAGIDAICQQASCLPDSGQCTVEPDHEGFACDDADPCTVGDKCADMLCTPGVPVNCNDGDVCTDDSCEAGVGCSYSFNSAPCNDGDACTISDACVQGECAGGQLKNCDDGNTCTDDTCDPVFGCVYEANNAPCDDGNDCTLGDNCAEGACVTGGDLSCDDDNPCTADGCIANGGCIHDAVDGACDDGNPCTVNDYCVLGQCISGTGAQCDDNNPCTDDECTGQGVCLHNPNEAACDDGNACTLGDHCALGKCAFDGPVDCDDGEVCTTNSCDPATGCLTILNDAPCDDGDLCTFADHCELGECVGGSTMACDDNNPCTDDSCSPDGGCTFAPNDGECDDANACTDGDHCADGVCAPGQQISCNDGDVCTDDSCDLEQGCVYGHNTAPCNDQNKCTVGEACADGLCGGGEEANCTDGDLCTDDLCDPATGCYYVHNNAQCDDGDACTGGDACIDGACEPGAAVTCDDGNPCTNDWCDPDTGCHFDANAALCDDGNECTEGDYCENAGCVSGAQVLCNDSNLCTDDVCDPNSGCVFTPNKAPCSDDDECTDDDKCDGGSCASGPPLVCFDGNECTAHSCEPAAGCTYAPLPNGTDCGVDWSCVDGQCVECPSVTGSQTFGYTGGQQTFVVPECVDSVVIEVWGAQGGGSKAAGGPDQEDGGKGGYAKGTLAVTPGQTLYIYVGAKGVKSGNGGWNGGGHGGHYAGGGGGGTDVRAGGTGWDDRVIVGGGGAGGQTGAPDHGYGGDGGGLSGNGGGSSGGWQAGGGGTQNGGGSAGSQCSGGGFGTGGSKASYHVSGGGGGWYGGGCSYGAGGGGGSSYYGGCTNGATSTGGHSGNGSAKISW